MKYEVIIFLLFIEKNKLLVIKSLCIFKLVRKYFKNVNVC